MTDILIASYNQAKYVTQALESVASQTVPVNVVIIDDRSTDGSQNVVREWLKKNGKDWVFIENPENYGVCKTFNIALSHCSNKYVALLAADDYYTSIRVQEHERVLNETNVGAVYSDSIIIDEAGNVARWSAMSRYKNHFPCGRIYNDLALGNWMPAHCVTFRRDCLDKVGTFDESLVYEDWDMWLRIAEHYDFVYHPATLAAYRQVKTSIMNATLKQRTQAVIESDIAILTKVIDGSDDASVIKDTKETIAVLRTQLAR